MRLLLGQARFRRIQGRLRFATALAYVGEPMIHYPLGVAYHRRKSEPKVTHSLKR